MSGSRNAWRPALRMASRDVRRHPLRSLLVVVLVGLPVLLSIVAATLISTQQESVADRLPAELGTAQASVGAVSGPATQTPDGGVTGYEGEAPPPTYAELRPGLAALTGGTLLPVERGSSRLVLGSRGWEVDVLRTDLETSLTRGMSILESGRQARDPAEVVVTRALAGDGATIGTTVLVGGREVTVVGIGTVGTVGQHLGDRAVAVPEASVVPASPGDELTVLVDRPEAVTWSDVKAWNRQGFIVVSRSVVLDPPPASQQYDDIYVSGDGVVTQLAAIVVTALIIEVVLLAGPAFAVSVRRQRHQLATVAAAGGGPRDLRRIVLAQALVLGSAACVAAVVLAVPMSWVAVQVAARVFHLGVGPFDVMGLAIVLAAALGILASVLAAVVPAREAARSDVVAALAGRAPAPRPSVGWPLAGLGLMGLSVVGIVGARSEMAIATLMILTVVGAVMLTPAVVGLVGRSARRLPLPMRLAVRDADRQRARSAPAIAAIMASVSAVTALAIGSSSDAAQGLRDHTYGAPVGTVTLSATTDTMPAVVAAAQRSSGATFTPLPELGAGEGDSTTYVMFPDPAQPGSASSSPVAVADAAVLKGWGVTITASQQSALDKGSALVADSSMIEDGSVAVTTRDGMSKETSIRLSAVVAELGTGSVPRGREPVVAGAVISAATAERLSLPVVVTKARSNLPARDISVAAVRESVLGADPAVGDVSVEQVQGSTYGPIFMILAVLGSLAIALGTFSATGLALSDARTDLATLAAVGASPRARRWMAGSQALVLSAVGAMMGLLVGFVPGIAAARTLTGAQQSGGVLDVPWLLLAILVVAMPLVVAAVTAVVSRGGRPILTRDRA